MFGALWMPRFRLQAALRWREDAGPAAVLEGDARRGRILEANDEATADGVEPGMAPAQALARCPGLRLAPRSAAAEAAVQAGLVGLALEFSPRVEATADGLCTLDLSAAPRGACWQRMGGTMVARGTEEGLAVRVGVAPHPDHAWLAAVAGSDGRLGEPSLPGGGPTSVNIVYDGAPFCAGLPMAVLGPSAALAAVLVDWGVRTIGEFLRLPADAVVERLGPEAAALRRRAGGRSRRALRLVRPAEELAEAFDFDYAVETTEPLLFLLRRFGDALAGRLRAGHRVAEGMTLTLTLDGAADYVRTFSIPAPTADADALFRILATHLEALTLEHQPTGVRLRVAAGHAAGRQLQLFERALRDPNGFGETLAHLKALVGEDGVGVPQPADTHQPGAFRLEEFAEATGGTDGGQRKGLPLRRLRSAPGRAVRLRAGRPAWIEGEGPVARAAGPYLESGPECGEASWRLEEWDVELEGGGLLRLAQGPGGRWSVEGTYDVC